MVKKGAQHAHQNAPGRGTRLRVSLDTWRDAAGPGAALLHLRHTACMNVKQEYRLRTECCLWLCRTAYQLVAITTAMQWLGSCFSQHAGSKNKLALSQLLRGSGSGHGESWMLTLTLMPSCACSACHGRLLDAKTRLYQACNRYGCS